MSQRVVPVDPEAVLLCQIPGMSAPLLQRLVDRWETPSGILRAPSSALRAFGVSPAIVARIVAAPRQIAATVAGLQSLERMSIDALAFPATDYPQRLRDLPRPPLLLYIQGQWPPCTPALAFTRADRTAEMPDDQRDTMRRFLSGLATLGVGILTTTDDLALVPATGSTAVLPYGLLLARSRVPEPVRAAVAEGHMTLISVAPFNAQSTTQLEAEAYAVQMALADGVLVVGDELPAPETLRPQTYRWKVQMEEPPGRRRQPHAIPADESGAHQIARVLGISITGSATVQQEQLW